VFRSHLTDDPGGQSGAGEGHAEIDRLGEAELSGHLADLMLEQLLQGFDDLEAEALFGVDADLL
jgi:hypothetical protein